MIVLGLLILSGYLVKRGLWNDDFWAMLVGGLIFGAMIGMLTAVEKAKEQEKKEDE